MKIFITIPWYLPAFRAGGPIRSVANLVSEYRDPEYYIFCGDTDINGAALEGIQKGEWVLHESGVKVWHAKPGKISQSLSKQVEEIKPDVIFMIGLFSWHYTLVPMIFCKVPKKIISVRGMLHPGALAQKSWKKKMFLRTFKLFEYPYKVWFHATDETEKTYIQNQLGDVARVVVAGNIPTNIGHMPMPEKVSGKLKMVTVSLISPMKNILKALQALKQVKAHVEYTIYGALKDEEYWQECKKMMRQLPENISVIYKGVAAFDEVKDCLAASHIFIMPSESENFGHALYEALSAGRPVITSHHTPWNKLGEKKAGINLDPADENEIIKAIEFFAKMDAATLDEWSQSASSYATARFDKAKLLAAYRKMFVGE